MRTGTRTVREPSLMMSEPATIWGRCSRTASRIFSLCRSQSREPRENSSYHEFSVSESSPEESELMNVLSRCRAWPALLLRQQSGHVIQCLLCAVLVVTVLLDQSLLDHGNLLSCLIVWPCGRGYESQHVAPLLEQVLLDRLTHPRMARQSELLSGLERDHRLADDLLPEGLLSGLGHLDLLLDRAHEALIRRARLARHRIGHLALIEGRLDLVQIFFK